MKRFFVIFLAALAVMGAVVPRTALGGFWHPGNALDVIDTPMGVQPVKESRAQLDHRISAYEGTPPILPKSADDWFQLGMAYSAAEKPKESVNALRMAVKLDPENFEAWNRLGLSLAETGSVNESVDAFQHVVELHPDFSEGWGNLALDFIKEGRLPQAERYLKKALALDSRSKQLWNAIIRFHVAQGQPDMALTAADNALKIDPQFSYALLNRGLILYSKHDVPSAIASVRHAVRSAPGFLHARVVLEMWLADADRLQEAAWIAMETLTRDPSERNSLEIVARYDLQRHRSQEGIKEAMKARALGYDGIDSLNSLVNVLANFGRFEEAEKVVKETMAAHPKDENPVILLGIVRLRQKRIEEAATLLKKALEMNAKNPRAFTALSEIQRQQDRPDESIQSAKKAIELDARNAAAWISIGASEEKRGNMDAARAAYQKAAEVQPANYLCWQAVALSASDYAKAMEAANKAAATSPDENATQALPGIIQRKFNKNEDAIASYEQTLKSYPESFEAGEELFGTFVSLNRIKEGEAFFLGMTREKPASALGWLLLGQVYDHEKKYEDAHEALLKSAKIAPGNAIAWIGLASVSMEAVHHLQSMTLGGPPNPKVKSVAADAETSLRKALEIEPSNAIGFERLALALILQNRYGDAQAAARKAISLDGNMANARFQLASSLYLAGNARDAIESYLKAIALSKSFPFAWNGMGLAHRDLGEMDKAMECYEKAVQEMPGYAEAWNNIGFACFTAGKLSEAIDAYQHAIDADPADVKALANLAQAAAKAGDAKLASKACDQLAKLDTSLADETRRRFLK